MTTFAQEAIGVADGSDRGARTAPEIAREGMSPGYCAGLRKRRVIAAEGCSSRPGCQTFGRDVSPCRGDGDPQRHTLASTRSTQRVFSICPYTLMHPLAVLRVFQEIALV